LKSKIVNFFVTALFSIVLRKHRKNGKRHKTISQPEDIEKTGHFILFDFAAGIHIRTGQFNGSKMLVVQKQPACKPGTLPV